MRQVLIYARVSTNDGTQDYNRQIDDLKSIAIKNGYIENRILVFAESISGFKKKDDRPQLKAMLDLIELNPSEYEVYTSEISRIGREPSETRKIIDRLSDIGVPVYIQTLDIWTIENGKRNSNTNIILQVLMEYAKVEADTFKFRSKSGMRKSALSGKMGGGKSWAYGYAKDDKGMVVIDEEEANVIREIFEMYKEGNGYRVISNYLISRDIPTRFNKSFDGNKMIGNKMVKNIKWSDSNIYTILQNTIYYGERKYKDEIIPAPAIISKELFDECTAMRKGKEARNFIGTYTYLLKDVCKCGKCGKNYFGKYKVDKYGDKVYTCASKISKDGSCVTLV
jgi:DNA invertase Pin-like site-specific DNA recombinase